MSLVATTPNDLEIRTERTFAASRERVWRAHTDADQLARWWGRGNRLVVEALDVRPGGKWRFVEHAPDGEYGFFGEFVTVDAPSLLVQTFSWDGMKEKSILNTASFEELGDKTRLIVLSKFTSKADRDHMLAVGSTKGQEESYVALDRLLNKGA